MKVLITGGAGFIGSQVGDAYIAAGHEVWVLDDLSRGNLDNVNPAARLVRMDLRSPHLRDILAEGAFDCVNHHAAQIDVRVSVADPVRDATVNILGTLNLLEAVRAVGVRRLIFASTGGAIYGAQRRYPADENHPTAPQSPYGVAKLAVEHYLEYYRQVHGLQYTVLRYSNVYGPRQDPHGEAGVVAIFAGRVLGRQRLIVYGDGSQTRDYVYVGDVARANLLALNRLTQVIERTAPAVSGSIDPITQQLTGLDGLDNSTDSKDCLFNIGTGIETSVNDLAATLLNIADAKSPIVYQPARPGEQQRSCIDPNRAQRVLGWKPIVSLAEGLHNTFAWFRARQTDTAKTSRS